MKHVIAISGGKDSVAMALRLKELNPGTDYEYITTPTGNELPEVDEHLSKLESILGKPFIRLQPFGVGKDGLIELIRQQGMIPNFRARFCTRILKIAPTLDWLEKNSPAVQYVGLRADEETREGIYDEKLPDGITQVYPMRDWGWGIGDVWEYLDSRGVSIPERTDCALCFYQKLIEWKRLRDNHPGDYEKGVEIEAEIGHTFRSNGRDSWPASLAELAAEFDRGKRVRGEEDYNQRLLFDCDRQAMCRVCSM